MRLEEKHPQTRHTLKAVATGPLDASQEGAPFPTHQRVQLAVRQAQRSVLLRLVGGRLLEPLVRHRHQVLQLLQAEAQRIVVLEHDDACAAAAAGSRHHGRVAVGQPACLSLSQLPVLPITWTHHEPPSLDGSWRAGPQGPHSKRGPRRPPPTHPAAASRI